MTLSSIPLLEPVARKPPEPELQVTSYSSAPICVPCTAAWGSGAGGGRCELRAGRGRPAQSPCSLSPAPACPRAAGRVFCVLPGAHSGHFLELKDGSEPPRPGRNGRPRGSRPRDDPARPGTGRKRAPASEEPQTQAVTAPLTPLRWREGREDPRPSWRVMLSLPAGKGMHFTGGG